MSSDKMAIFSNTEFMNGRIMYVMFMHYLCVYDVYVYVMFILCMSVVLCMSYFDLFAVWILQTYQAGGR